MFDRLSRLERRFRRISEQLSPFELREQPEQAPLDDVTLTRELYGRAGSDRFLGFYSEAGIRRALEAFGIRRILSLRGFPELEISLDLEDPFRHRLRIFSSVEARPEHLLIDFCAHLGRGKEGLERLLPEPVTLLVIDWLQMQDPTRAFEPGARLPGQLHPGLGIGLEIGTMIGRIAQRLKVDGCVNHPAWFHNAAMYRLRYHYVAPWMEGRLKALIRDTNGHSLAEISWAIEHGCVLEGWRDPGVPVAPSVLRWEGRPQLWALTPQVRKHFRTPVWHGIRDSVRDALGFEVDWEKARRMRQQDPACAPLEPEAG